MPHLFHSHIHIVNFSIVVCCPLVLSCFIFLSPPDITPPVVTLNPPNPQTIEAGIPWINPGATAFDSAEGNVTASVTFYPLTPNLVLLGPQTVGLAAGVADAALNRCRLRTLPAMRPGTSARPLAL